MSKSLARVLHLLMLLVAFGALSSCSKNEPERVLLLLKTLDNPFFQDIDSGFRSKWLSTSIKVDVLAGKNEADAPGQREILETYLRNFVRGRDKPLLKGVVLTPSDSGDGLVPSIAELRRNGIPVLLVDTAISPKSLREAKTDFNILFSSDNFSGGESAGKLIVSALANKGGSSVLVLNGVPEHDTAKLRREGFLQATRSFGLVITERTANWRRSEARTIVEAFRNLGKLPDAIFAANDEMAIGAIEALKRSQSGVPIIVGFDATNEARALVKDGALYATIAQSPRLMGERAAEALSHIVQGEKAPLMHTVPIPVAAITKSAP